MLGVTSEAWTWQSNKGLILTASLWFTSFLMALELRFVVQRAKKCASKEVFGSPFERQRPGLCVHVSHLSPHRHLLLRDIPLQLPVVAHPTAGPTACGALGRIPLYAGEDRKGP